ncbi:hypothetical protein [Mycolicibacter arupensis]|uniref:Uncharacterized protein n=1 Tax=Mycolicibacter arupensis TaxID=342002 RepID=A0A5C7XXV0_9MYCO|nr:hypothetical protein [Mycolicibacter arupensis]TXI54300.1 MAG: hypothetical protein E6Q54_15105 [Mycolicibacter arupensis]
MEYTITTTAGEKFTCDTTAGQELEFESSGGLTFRDAPEGDVRSVVAYSPAAWAKVSYVTKTRGGAGFAH